MTMHRRIFRFFIMFSPTIGDIVELKLFWGNDIYSISQNGRKCNAYESESRFFEWKHEIYLAVEEQKDQSTVDWSFYIIPLP